MPTKISATMIIAPRYKTSAETRHCKKIRMRRQARLFRPLPFLSLNPGYLTLQYQITQSKNRKEKNKKTKEDLGGGGEAKLPQQRREQSQPMDRYKCCL